VGVGLWSSIKSAVRQVVRVVIEVANRFTLGIGDLLLGFVGWPRKKLRIHVCVLADANGPVVSDADLQDALDYATRVFADRFNVKVVRFGESFVQAMKDPAPPDALEVDCGFDGWLADFGSVGEFFAKHVAGWNVIPVGAKFPVTVFVVRDVKGTKGCSLGPLTDYVVLDIDGVAITSTMAHEVAHACGLWHSGSSSNLMFHPDNRGDRVKWFQKNLFRSSRHVQFW
jgi:hypothetical protein